MSFAITDDGDDDGSDVWEGKCEKMHMKMKEIWTDKVECLHAFGRVLGILQLVMCLR